MQGTRLAASPRLHIAIARPNIVTEDAACSSVCHCH